MYRGTMQEPDSKDYFEKRAAEERAAAERCDDERAAQSHRALAEQYEEQARSRPSAEKSERDEEPGCPGILPPDFRILP